MTVEELLNKRDISYIPKGSDFLVRCLNEGHEDRNPSMRIDQVTGIYNCWSCSFSGNIFSLFDEAPDWLEMKRQALKKKIVEKRFEDLGVDLPTDLVPYEGRWRDISPETYKKFEAFEHHDTYFIGRINFPIRDISGKVVAIIGRHTSGGVPKYQIYPKMAKMPLYPRAEPIQGRVILVEGIFDMLNLYEKGLTNAVCCFGTKLVNENKLNILKMQGVSGIDIMMDADEAGKASAERLQDLCEKCEIQSRVVNLRRSDPGDLSAKQVLRLKDKLYG